MAQMVKHATEPPPRLADFLPNFPPALQLVLDKLLAKDPADRYQTPFEAVEAMQTFLPERNVTPVGSAVLPAYREWLESEWEKDPSTLPIIATPAGENIECPKAVDYCITCQSAAPEGCRVQR